jgi:hypothetical protein
MKLWKLGLGRGWLLFLVATVALGGAGAGYAAWTASLHVEGTIQTGSVDAVWDQQTDREFVGILNPQTGLVVDGPIPEGKDVADCESSLQEGQVTRIVNFVVSNAYPSYTCEVTVGAIVLGSVPVHISQVRTMATDAAGTDVVGKELDVSVRLTRKVATTDGFECLTEQPIGVSTQLHRGDRFCAIIRIHPRQAAKQNHTYKGGVWIDLIQWNLAGEQLGPTLPVFTVNGAGISAAQASSIATSLLGPAASEAKFQDGVLSFIDPVKFQAVPMTLLDSQPTNWEEEEPLSEPAFEAFNLELIKSMQPFSGEGAMGKVREALTKAQADPLGGLPTVQNTMFEAVEKSRAGGLLPVASALIDTHVHYNFQLAGLPYVGPGAQVNVAFDTAGMPTQLYYSAHSLQQGSSMPVLPTSMAMEACMKLYPGQEPQLSPTLAYYAPPLVLGANMVLPHYDCQGTSALGDGETNLLQNLVPAVDDPKFVPVVNLSASFNGDTVNASAAVTGGRPPYTFHWTSLNADLSGETGATVEYPVEPREDVNSDTVMVTVVDSNGIAVTDTAEVDLVQPDGRHIGDGVAASSKVLARPSSVGGVTDFGIERAVSNMCSGNVNGYSGVMDDEAFKRFHWTGTNAWERDFKHNSDHNAMVDNVDETFYCGHGNGGGFTFEGSTDDGKLSYPDPRISANGDWGDSDLEYLALLSCQVLKQTYDGLSWASRWGPAFDGLHLLLGFQTNAYDWSDFGKRFAQYQLGRDGRATLPVRAAWHQAALEEQPSGVQSVVMGVMGNGLISNYNDYFWGQGSVGPDVREPDITGYWRLTITTP